MAPISGQARNGGTLIARAQFDFGGASVLLAASPSQQVASKRDASPMQAAL
jgi:hypothetical protein